MKEYKPQAKTREILDWCLVRIQSVPYRVTSRWLFYRLVEEKGKKKSDYKNFLQYSSRARKRFYNGWKPDTLVDDTRESTERGFGYKDENSWLQHFKKEEAIFDMHYDQDNIIEIWFEAQAMYSQFNYYTSPYRLTLRPFKGDASIDYKWSIAQDLNYLARYDKPITILYFGDYDEKGFSIPLSAVKDIREWCDIPFDFIRCGINKEHIGSMGIIKAFDKKETYQWEALNEDNARALIIGNIEKYWSLEKVKEVEARELKATERWKVIIERSLR